MIGSPCVNICRMEAGSGLCEGCLRTIDEIAGWAKAGDSEKMAILAAVERRRAGRNGRNGRPVATVKNSTERANDE